LKLFFNQNISTKTGNSASGVQRLFLLDGFSQCNEEKIPLKKSPFFCFVFFGEQRK
jgi:hypothetical protein